MSKLSDLEQRIAALEAEMRDLRAKTPADHTSGKWWVENAGRFRGDSVFQEIVKLGREYRESLQPGRRKKADSRK